MENPAGGGLLRGKSSTRATADGKTGIRQRCLVAAHQHFSKKYMFNTNCGVIL